MQFSQYQFQFGCQIYVEILKISPVSIFVLIISKMFLHWSLLTMRLSGSELPNGLSLPLPSGGLLLVCCDSSSRNCWCSRFLIRKIFGIVIWCWERCTTLSLTLPLHRSGVNELRCYEYSQDCDTMRRKKRNAQSETLSVTITKISCLRVLEKGRSTENYNKNC